MSSRRHGGAGPDAHVPRGPGPELADLPDRLVHGGPHRARPGQQDLADLRQHETAAGAREQLGTDRCLQALDALRGRRLRAAKPFRSPAEMAEVGDHLEEGEVTQVHRIPPGYCSLKISDWTADRRADTSGPAIRASGPKSTDAEPTGSRARPQVRSQGDSR